LTYSSTRDYAYRDDVVRERNCEEGRRHQSGGPRHYYHRGHLRHRQHFQERPRAESPNARLHSSQWPNGCRDFVPALHSRRGTSTHGNFGTHGYLTVLTGTHVPCSPNGPRRSPTRRFDFHWQRTNAAALAQPRPFPSNSGPISHLGANSHLARRPRFDAMRGAPLSAALRAWLRAYLEAKGCKSIKFAVLLDKVSVTGIHGSVVLGNRYS